MTCGRGWFIYALLLHFPSRDMNHLAISTCRRRAELLHQPVWLVCRTQTQSTMSNQPGSLSFSKQAVHTSYSSCGVFPWLFALWREYHASHEISALIETSPERLCLSPRRLLWWLLVLCCRCRDGASLLCLLTNLRAIKYLWGFVLNGQNCPMGLGKVRTKMHTDRHYSNKSLIPPRTRLKPFLMKLPQRSWR